MRKSDIHLPIGRITFDFWELALRNLLGWSDAQIEEWAEQFRSGIENESDPIYHYPFGKFLAPLFIDKALKQKLRERGVLTETLKEIADCMNEYIYPELQKGEGWDEARMRIQNVIQRLGLS
jgi:hypothetical protein